MCVARRGWGRGGGLCGGGGWGGGFPGHLRRLETQILEADRRTPSPDRRLLICAALSRTEGRYPQRRLDPVRRFDSAAVPVYQGGTLSATL